MATCFGAAWWRGNGGDAVGADVGAQQARCSLAVARECTRAVIPPPHTVRSPGLARPPHLHCGLDRLQAQRVAVAALLLRPQPGQLRHRLPAMQPQRMHQVAAAWGAAAGLRRGSGAGGMRDGGGREGGSGVAQGEKGTWIRIWAGRGESMNQAPPLHACLLLLAAMAALWPKPAPSHRADRDHRARTRQGACTHAVAALTRTTRTRRPVLLHACAACSAAQPGACHARARLCICPARRLANFTPPSPPAASSCWHVGM